MKIKVSETTDQQLDWLVALCQGAMNRNPGLRDAETFKRHQARYPMHCYTKYADQGLPIIERHVTGIYKVSSGDIDFWEACVGYEGYSGHAVAQGPTMLVAGLQACVMSEMGDEVEIPEELGTREHKPFTNDDHNRREPSK